MPSMLNHNKFESETRAWLESRGFYTAQSPYHEHWPKPIVDTLKTRFSATALYLRGRADRAAVHRTLPIEFEFEVKMHESANKHDICLEALPFVHHMHNCKLQVRCMYIHRDPFIGREIGFWVHDMPQIRALFIPNRFRDDTVVGRLYNDVLPLQFPGADVVRTDWGNGSGDPFIVIDYRVAEQQPDWRLLVDREIESCGGAVRVGG